MDADPLREFDDGVAFWATRPKWPADLHNRFYADQQAITDGAFTSTWWNVTRRKLYDWRATRGARLADLDRLFHQHQGNLVTIWQTVIQPQLSGDITSVTWDEVRALPDLARLIKPTRGNSAVFPSKLAHFIAPPLFPVFDKTALPGGHNDYGSYFNHVKDTWNSTDRSDQQALRARLALLIESRSGRPMVSGYPVVNKIVELRLIGQHHRSAS
ncbi:hypothetical protein [Virgisporangium aurantiacum]|uniref:Uncharacterized protein n=1 Tax=Virgisporangium aurantiacum TaxID=175570 RepID=A0A8J4E828_9ACTN|nr:hypothetical protein [Virgisporangium aurantiacum]GIJ62382.1 hypothetical protein Vau01_098980 [Virgisporangium aurantiacum]